MITVRLTQLLEKQNKTMYWLSEKTGITYPTIHKIANNKTRSINFDVLEKICIALECEIGDVLKLEIKKEEA